MIFSHMALQIIIFRLLSPTKYFTHRTTHRTTLAHANTHAYSNVLHSQNKKILSFFL